MNLVWKKYIYIYIIVTFLEIQILFIKHPLKFMTGNTWWLTKVGAKLLSDLVILSIFSSDIPFDFQKSIQVVPLKYSTYFLSGINTKKIWNISHEEHFAPLKILFAKYAQANLAVFFFTF